LYASFRRRDEICSWDLRGNTVNPLQTFRCDDGSRLETNQKMKFDIDLGGNLMGVGDHSGNVNIFNLGVEPTDEVGAEAVRGTAPALKYHAHDDAVGSIAFHPLNPLLLSVSGSRHFGEIDSSEEESSDSSMSRDARRHPSVQDNSFRLWQLVV